MATSDKVYIFMFGRKSSDETTSRAEIRAKDIKQAVNKAEEEIKLYEPAAVINDPIEIKEVYCKVFKKKGKQHTTKKES